MAPPLLTVEEVLTKLPVSRSTLYAMFKSGELPKRKLRGRTVVSEADLERLVADAAVVVAPARPKSRRVRPTDVVEFFK